MSKRGYIIIYTIIFVIALLIYGIWEWNTSRLGKKRNVEITPSEYSILIKQKKSNSALKEKFNEIASDGKVTQEEYDLMQKEIEEYGKNLQRERDISKLKN